MAEIALILACLAASLQADRFSVRESAHRALARSGWLAWPALRSVEQDGDSEARYRAGRLLGELVEPIPAPKEVEDEGP